MHFALSISGDGDWRHIGYKVARPGAFEIASVCVVHHHHPLCALNN
jgi:hypothetical protein